MAGNLLRVGPTATLGYQFPRTLALVAFNYGFTCCRLTMPGFLLTRTCFDLAYSVLSGSIALSSARRCGAAAGRRSRGSLEKRSLTRDRGFESFSLQRRVRCELGHTRLSALEGGAKAGWVENAEKLLFEGIDRCRGLVRVDKSSGGSRPPRSPKGQHLPPRGAWSAGSSALKPAVGCISEAWRLKSHMARAQVHADSGTAQAIECRETSGEDHGPAPPRRSPEQLDRQSALSYA
jgi:hypothetical protein